VVTAWDISLAYCSLGYSKILPLSKAKREELDGADYSAIKSFFCGVIIASNATHSSCRCSWSAREFSCERSSFSPVRRRRRLVVVVIVHGVWACTTVLVYFIRVVVLLYLLRVSCRLILLYSKSAKAELDRAEFIIY
jgi:hypothetical protein